MYREYLHRVHSSWQSSAIHTASWYDRWRFHPKVFPGFNGFLASYCTSLWTKNLFRIDFYKPLWCILKARGVFVTTNKPAVLCRLLTRICSKQIITKGMQHQLSSLGKSRHHVYPPPNWILLTSQQHPFPNQLLGALKTCSPEELCGTFFFAFYTQFEL